MSVTFGGLLIIENLYRYKDYIKVEKLKWMSFMMARSFQTC